MKKGEIMIKKVKVPMTDGSYCFDVEISTRDALITLNMCSEHDADTIVKRLYDQINMRCLNKVIKTY